MELIKTEEIKTNVETINYLSFKLSNEIYSIKLSAVQQIIKYDDITKVPLSPDYIMGVINLRGKIVPVIDIRVKYNMSIEEITDRTCIVILDIVSNRYNFSIGFEVDEVMGVDSIYTDLIEDVPEFGVGINVDFLSGVGRINDDIRLLIDSEKLFSLSELIS